MSVQSPSPPSCHASPQRHTLTSASETSTLADDDPKKPDLGFAFVTMRRTWSRISGSSCSSRIQYKTQKLQLVSSRTDVLTNSPCSTHRFHKRGAHVVHVALDRAEGKAEMVADVVGRARLEHDPNVELALDRRSNDRVAVRSLERIGIHGGRTRRPQPHSVVPAVAAG